MKTRIEDFNNVRFEVLDSPDFFWPCASTEAFPTCCGSGKFGDSVVPDSFFSISISPACWIHDRMFELVEKTWPNFHYSNSVFYRNIWSILSTKGTGLSTGELIISGRMALHYYEAVTTLGPMFFFPDRKNCIPILQK